MFKLRSASARYENEKIIPVPHLYRHRIPNNHRNLRGIKVACQLVADYLEKNECLE